MIAVKAMLHCFFLLGVVSGLSACYEDPTVVTLHQARHYKGKVDEHSTDANWRAEQLRERFRQVQTDR
jgi:hypothetical protein